MTENRGARWPQGEYRPVLIACLAMILITVVYWQSFSRMIDMWSLSNYQHGWVVYPISVFVLWSKRHALAAAGLQVSWVGVALTAVVVLVWIAARTVGIQAAEFVSATLLIFTSFWAFAGTRAMQAAAFPLALLLAAAPVGEFLVPYLMESTADIATALLSVAGVPVYREAMFLTLPGGSFEVAEVCSGLRYLLAGIMASLAYAYVTYAGLAKRAAFVAIAAVALVIANGVRAFVVMFVASATEMRVFTGEDHVLFGMFLFAVVFIALVFIGERYADPADTKTDYPVTRTTWQGGMTASAAAVATLAVLVAGPGFEYVKAQQRLPVAAIAKLPDLPGCSGPNALTGDGPLNDWSPDYGGADYLVRGTFACGDYRASIYVAGYWHQRQGTELINSSHRIWPYDWRQYVEESVVSVASNHGSVDVREAVVQAPDRRMLIRYWYQVGDAVIGSESEVKLLKAFHALSLEPIASSVVAIAITDARDTGMPALRDELEPLVHTVMSWNRNREHQVLGK